MGRGGGRRLAAFIPMFSGERFLWDYLDDGKLMVRLNQVMRRVKLPALPADFARLLPAARRLVAERQAELLTRPRMPRLDGDCKKTPRNGLSQP